MNAIIDVLKSYRSLIRNSIQKKDLNGVKDKKSKLVSELRSKVNSLKNLPKSAIEKINALINDIDKAEDPSAIISLINKLINIIEGLDLLPNRGRSI
jgi:phage-related protein